MKTLIQENVSELANKTNRIPYNTEFLWNFKIITLSFDYSINCQITQCILRTEIISKIDKAKTTEVHRAISDTAEGTEYLKLSYLVIYIIFY